MIRLPSYIFQPKVEIRALVEPGSNSRIVVWRRIRNPSADIHEAISFVFQLEFLGKGVMSPFRGNTSSLTNPVHSSPSAPVVRSAIAAGILKRYAAIVGGSRSAAADSLRVWGL